MSPFWSTVSILLVLLNPFSLSVYLVHVLQEQPLRVLSQVLRRAASIAFVVFSLFAWSGERFFTDILAVRYAAFLIFGGLVFLLIGLKYMLEGTATLQSLRGEPAHLAGAIAMPFLIGPATVSASILAGARLPLWQAMLAILAALTLSVCGLLLLKLVLDHVRERNVRLIQRYVEITGRVAALIVGTVAVEMLMQGIDIWLSLRES